MALIVERSLIVGQAETFEPFIVNDAIRGDAPAAACSRLAGEIAESAAGFGADDWHGSEVPESSHGIAHGIDAARRDQREPVAIAPRAQLGSSLLDCSHHGFRPTGEIRRRDIRTGDSRAKCGHVDDSDGRAFVVFDGKEVAV